MVSTRGEAQVIHLNNYEALVHMREKHQLQNLYEHCKRKMSPKSSETKSNTVYSMETQGKDHQQVTR